MSCERLKNILTELKTLINNKDANNENYKTFFQKWNIPYKSDLEKKITDNCASWNVQSGSNVMEVDPKCVEATKELCSAMSKSLKLPIFKDFDPDTWDEKRWPSDYRNCYWEFAPYLINNTQTNSSIVQSECRINTILGDPELTNNKELAAAVAMILTKRIVSCDPKAINEYYDAFSSSEKINAFSTCVNSVVSEQQNYLKGCRLSNKVQKNVSDIVQNCLITTSFDRESKVPVEEQIKPIQVSTTRPTINPILPETTQTPIPIPILTHQPIENKDFMVKNTIIFIVSNFIIIFLMVIIKKFFISN